MTQFTDRTGERFELVDLTDSRFTMVRLNGVRLHSCELHGVVMRGVEIDDGSIDGDINRLVVNGVDVMPFVTAELDRREPDRAKFRPTTPDGFRAAWDLNEQLWSRTVERARRLDPELLHESVDGEWSFIETLRHLAFATESWVGRAIDGDPTPWQPLSLPWDEMRPREGVPRDRDARPSLEEALAVRESAMTLMRRAVDTLTDERLAARTDPLVGPGWPDGGESFDVRECLLIVLNEEWSHRMFAERDLAVLERRK